ncbi:MAG: diaminopimelate epimerase [Alphaproteobacteria bacterium]
MSSLHFTKMHGLGNDFVILDARRDAIALDPVRARAIADRHTGVGCDQIILMAPPADAEAEIFMHIHNADGGEVAACGNAMRCVAALLLAETGRDSVRIQTLAGLLDAGKAEDARITVDMDIPGLAWNEIPLAEEQDTLSLPISAGPLAKPVAVSMGNPHAVFFVDDAEKIDLAALGPGLEHDPIFPERANIGIAQVTGENQLRLRVWERGVGITMACGTGACAATVAAHRRGLTGRIVTVTLDGGALEIDWREDDHVLMTGPVATSFTGELDLAALA